MKLAILTAAALTLAACTPPNTLVCNRDAIAWDKWGDVTAMADNCLPASPRPLARPVTASGDDNNPTPPTSNPPNVTPPSEPPTTPEKPDRVKGNNGWGNGDQSPPGNSGANNNAENDRGGRSQRNHGNAKSN